MLIDKMLLITGQDIPLLNSNIIVHNPSLKEIVNIFLKEDNFFTGYELLFFSKDQLEETERQVLHSLSDFEILLSLLMSKDASPMKEQLICLDKLLMLLFKHYDIKYEETQLVLTKDNHIFFIKEDEFIVFKDIVKELFPFKSDKGKVDYNPQGSRAEQIANKLKKARSKVLKTKKEQGLSFFERYISILTIGLKIPVFYFQEYTIYQLLNTFERYEKKEVYDVHLKAQLAGATGMKDVDHWMM